MAGLHLCLQIYIISTSDEITSCIETRKPYITVLNCHLRVMHEKGTKRVELGNLVSAKYAGGAQYVVDLSNMKHINSASGYTRDIKAVKAATTTVATLPVTAGR